ncbi:MAG TPA: hypothetical protein VIW70_06870 [Rubrivivax sp.]
MRSHRTVALSLVSAAAAALLVACATAPTTGPMGFFVTSAGPGNGANLGGLSGADAHCQKLAESAGAGRRAWRAYLSANAVPATAPAQPTPAVHARDRIGKGPGYNAKGVLIATDVAQLHDNNNLTKATALTEKGEVVNGRGDTPNKHDILTGSRLDGTAQSWNPNLTCNNWSHSGEGAATVGHHDRAGLNTDPWALSWNSSHQTIGCSAEALPRTGGAGLFYCFAAD